MSTVTLSSKFQIVIPKAVRDRLDLAAGQKFEAVVDEGLIELIPVRPIDEMRGFLAGIDATVEREPDRE